MQNEAFYAAIHALPIQTYTRSILIHALRRDGQIHLPFRTLTSIDDLYAEAARPDGHPTNPAACQLPALRNMGAQSLADLRRALQIAPPVRER